MRVYNGHVHEGDYKTRYGYTQQEYRSLKEANPDILVTYFPIESRYLACRPSAGYSDLGEMETMWSRITCPTLLIKGAESWASDPSKDGRLEAFPNATFEMIQDAEHWVHHDQLDEFLRVVRNFLAE